MHHVECDTAVFGMSCELRHVACAPFRVTSSSIPVVSPTRLVRHALCRVRSVRIRLRHAVCPITCGNVSGDVGARCNDSGGVSGQLVNVCIALAEMQVTTSIAQDSIGKPQG